MLFILSIVAAGAAFALSIPWHYRHGGIYSLATAAFFQPILTLAFYVLGLAFAGQVIGLAGRFDLLQLFGVLYFFSLFALPVTWLGTGLLTALIAISWSSSNDTQDLAYRKVVCPSICWSFLAATVNVAASCFLASIA